MISARDVVTFIDKPTYVVDLESFIANWVQQRYRGLGASLPHEFAKDKRSAVKWIEQIVNDPNRPCDSASLDYRVSLIRCLEKLLRAEFASTKDLRLHLDRYLDGHDGRRLPVAQAIKRARKKQKWTQRQLAEHLGLKDHSLISKYEKGERMPSERVLEWLKAGGM